MKRKILIICIDGFGPDYLEKSATPNLDLMAREGTLTIGRSMMPAVTNVNNVSIITGVPPRIHGITSNYWLDRKTGKETYMESAQFLFCPTVLKRAKEKGLITALLTSKKKLLHLLDTGADYSLAAEDPDKEMEARLGPAPDIYSEGINHWLFKALKVVLKDHDPDVVYCSTTDGVMHKHAPEEEESIHHIRGLDFLLGQIVDDNPNREIYVTADHGMSTKSRGIDLEKVLAAGNIGSRCIPIIKDRYTAHHQNLGGASYVYLDDKDTVYDAIEVLHSIKGIEAVYQREEAANQFDLMEERIGDALVLGDKDTVFGTFEKREIQVHVRSHGSLHESTVPIIVYGSRAKRTYGRNMDITASIQL
jgi:phosphonoacetate hydrolase